MPTHHMSRVDTLRKRIEPTTRAPPGTTPGTCQVSRADTARSAAKLHFICARSLSYTYPKAKSGPSLVDVNFTFDDRVLGVLGPNGAGKSTLFRLLSSAVHPSSGQVSVGGWSSASTKSEQRDFRAHLGLVPQDLQFDPSLTCTQTLEYVSWLKKIPKHRVDGSVTAALHQLDLGDRSHDRVGTLSGGLSRRLSIAQALLGSPNVILLDEPTNALDPAQRHKVLEHLRVLSHDVRLVVSSHRVEDIIELADSILLLNRGRVAWSGDLGQIGENATPSAAELESIFLSLTDTDETNE